jgi:autotransporter-associated beta strand protein
MKRRGNSWRGRRATWLAALAALQAGPCLAALLHTDTFSFNRTGTTQHFGDAQFAVLNYPSINGIYMDMGSDSSRSLITAANNDLMQQYNNFLTDYNTQPNASAEADAIYNYSITHSTSNGPRPHWVFLNEIGADYSSPPTGTGSNWYNTGTAGATYRKWVIDAVTRLHDVYNFDIVVASPGRTALRVQQSGYNPFASDWQTLASKAIIYVETFVSGPDVMNSGSNYASRLNWVKSYYQSEMNAYSVYAGVDHSRLGAGENYTNNATYDYYGRAGLASASDWDYVIMLREDALRTLNPASVDAYAWGGNAMLITEAEQIQHELYYRTRLVLPGQQPQWLPDNAYTIGDAATPVPLSWNQTLNWLGDGVVNGLPNSVPNSPGAVANFFRTNTSARTITLDGDKTIGTLTFNSPNSYTISPGSGGSILLNNSGSAAIVTVSQGSHSIAVPVQLQNNVNMTAGNVSVVLSISGAISGVGAITKAGSGTLVLSGANSYLGGTTINAGTLLVNNATGSGTGSGPVTVNNGGTLGGTGAISGAVTINGGGHIAPGASIESLDVGSLLLGAGSILDFELATILGVDTSDLIHVTTVGGLAIGGGTLNLTNAGSMTGGIYTLIDYSGSFTGSVSNITLGSVPTGFTYRLFNDPSSQSIDLEVTAPGDFNHDGTVDGADYVVFRKGLGTTYSPTDYDTWRTHFGQIYTPGAGAIVNTAVPEPATIVMLIIGTLVMCFRQRRAAVP